MLRQDNRTHAQRLKCNSCAVLTAHELHFGLMSRVMEEVRCKLINGCEKRARALSKTLFWVARIGSLRGVLADFASERISASSNTCKH